MIDFSKRNESGFTLVELTISLMVIGLLIGAVLKGQELIENARVTRAVKDVHDIEAAVITFQNMFDRALPGDLRKPEHVCPIAAIRLPHGHAMI